MNGYLAQVVDGHPIELWYSSNIEDTDIRRGKPNVHFSTSVHKKKRVLDEYPFVSTYQGGEGRV